MVDSPAAGSSAIHYPPASGRGRLPSTVGPGGGNRAGPRRPVSSVRLQSAPERVFCGLGDPGGDDSAGERSIQVLTFYFPHQGRFLIRGSLWIGKLEWAMPTGHLAALSAVGDDSASQAPAAAFGSWPDPLCPEIAVRCYVTAWVTRAAFLLGPTLPALT